MRSDTIPVTIIRAESGKNVCDGSNHNDPRYSCVVTSLNAAQQGVIASEAVIGIVLPPSHNLVSEPEWAKVSPQIRALTRGLVGLIQAAETEGPEWLADTLEVINACIPAEYRADETSADLLTSNGGAATHN